MYGKSCLEMVAKNGRFPATMGGLESLATVVSQHVCHFGRHLGFLKNFILHKIAASFTEISRKHVFPASNRNIIENRV